MKRKFAIVSALISLSVFADVARAAGSAPPVQGRVFIGALSPDFTALNAEMRSLGLEEFGTMPMFGAEVSYQLATLLEVGLNYSKRANVRKESASTGADYKAELDQDVAIGTVRIPFVKTSVMRFDVFAGAGGSNTTLKLKSATQTGELSKKDAGSFFASVVTRYGASAAFGFRGVYLVVEGGSETNKVDNLQATGTVGSNIQSIDFSSQYFTLGLLIDGVTLKRQ